MLSQLSSSPAGPSSQSSQDITLANFKAEVLDASRTALILLVFWLPRDPTGPQLITSLEKFVAASKGVLKLAKIDIERNTQIAQQMGVQEVPSVFAFHQGRPIDGFAGLLPDPQIKTWLDQLLKVTGAKSEEKIGFDSALKQAEDFLLHKDIATARSIYADIFDMDPLQAAAYAGLVRCFIEEGNTLKAREMFDATPAALSKDKIFNSIRTALELAEETTKLAEGGSAAVGELEGKLKLNPSDHQARFDLAMAYYALHKREEAIDSLLEIIKRARTWNEDAARKQLLKFFEALGASNPLTISARKRLSSILFS